jgi:nucleoid DNA-binding protein
MSYRKEIARQLSADFSGDLNHHRRILRKTLNIIIESLITDSRIELRGFGTFEINEVKQKQIIHPITRACHITKPFVIKFKPSKKVLNKLYNHQK